jgi:hypothetical protein
MMSEIQLRRILKCQDHFVAQDSLKGATLMSLPYSVGFDAGRVPKVIGGLSRRLIPARLWNTGSGLGCQVFYQANQSLITTDIS